MAAHEPSPELSFVISNSPITTLGDFDEFSGVVHDWWVDLETAQWDEAASVLEFILIRPLNRYRGAFKAARTEPGDACMVRIHNTKAAEIDDTQGIAHYPLRDFGFDPLFKRLTVESIIPMTLYAIVDRLEVSVASVGAAGGTGDARDDADG